VNNRNNLCSTDSLLLPNNDRPSHNNNNANNDDYTEDNKTKKYQNNTNDSTNKGEDDNNVVSIENNNELRMDFSSPPSFSSNNDLNDFGLDEALSIMDHPALVDTLDESTLFGISESITDY